MPEEIEDDEERVDLKLIQSFADKIQHLPSDEASSSRSKIIIPRRGEKDFEPLNETANLQDLMLQKSREALFGALVGVRGGNAKSISHAILSPQSHYPRMLISRGHVVDSMGITVRDKQKSKSWIELLPEEALYLLERGSLQIWLGPEGAEWREEEWGVADSVEMSVMEAFATFMGKDDLSWERYQAYTYLRRLGYTVQRTPMFLPARFKSSSTDEPFQTWWKSLPRWIYLGTLWISRKLQRVATSTSLLSIWTGSTYASIYRSLRVTPHGVKPLPCLDNPYTPFFHVWKPATPWSKVKWDKGSSAGLCLQPPEFAVAAINARTTPMPSLAQLSSIFEQLPDEPKGPTVRTGPQYQKPVSRQRTPTLWERLFPRAPGTNLGAIRSGDRALVVAVNDSGNTGWVRFGRTGFIDYPAFG